MRRSSRTCLQFVTFTFLIGSLSGSTAMAGDLKSPFALENTETLPVNVRNPRFINVFTSVTSRFNDEGSLEGLGQALNKTTLWRDALNEQEDPAKRTLLQGLLEANGLDLEGSPGSSRGEVNTYANVKVAALAWGITERFTLAGVLPIVSIDVSASTGFEPDASAGSQYNKFKDALKASSSPNAVREAINNFNDGVNRKLLRLGYKTIPSSQTISGIGDAQLVGKYRLYNDGVNSTALRGTFIMPTGIEPDPDKALDIPTGDGRFGLGVQAIYDRSLPWNFRFNGVLGYTALLPHHIVKRIPTSVRDPLSADKEEMYERTRSQYSASAGIDHLFPSVGIILGAGYTWQFQERSDYEAGTTYDEGRYLLLNERQPLQSLHSVVATAAFSTIDWYRNKKFVYPMQIGLSYAHPLAGRNVSSNDLVTGELIVFF